MQAILPVVVMGRKSGKYPRDNTKFMVEEVGVVLIDCVVTQFSAPGLSIQEIVVGCEEGKIKRNPKKVITRIRKLNISKTPCAVKRITFFHRYWQKASCTKRNRSCQEVITLRKILSNGTALQAYPHMMPSNAYLGATEWSVFD